MPTEKDTIDSKVVPRRATVDSIQEYGLLVQRSKKRKQASSIDAEANGNITSKEKQTPSSSKHDPNTENQTWTTNPWRVNFFYGLGWVLSLCNAIGAGAATYFTLHWVGLNYLGIAASSGFTPYDIFCSIQCLVIAIQNQSNYGRSMQRSTLAVFHCNDDPLVQFTENEIPNHIHFETNPWVMLENFAWYTLSFLGALIKAAMGAVGMITAMQAWLGPTALTSLAPLTAAVAIAVFLGSFFCNVTQQGNELRKHKVQMGHKQAILMRTAQRIAEYEEVLVALEYTTRADKIEAEQLGEIFIPLSLRFKKWLSAVLQKEDEWEIADALEANKKAQLEKLKNKRNFQPSPHYRALAWLEKTLPLPENWFNLAEKETQAKAQHKQAWIDHDERALLATIQARDALSFEWARLLKIKKDLGDAKSVLERALAESHLKGEPEGEAAIHHHKKGFDFDKKTATFLTLFGVKKEAYLQRSLGSRLKRAALQTYRTLLSKEVILALVVLLALAAAFTVSYFCFPVMALPFVMGLAALAGMASLALCALIYELVYKTPEQSLFSFENTKDRLFELRNIASTTVSVSNASGAGLDAWFSVVGVVAFFSGMAPALALGNPLIVGVCFLVVPVMYFMNYFMYKQKVQTLAKRHARRYEIQKFAEHSKKEKGIFHNPSSYQDNQRRAEAIADNQPLYNVIKNEFVKWFLMRNGGFIKSIKTALGSFGTWATLVQLVGVGVVIGVSVTQPVGIAIAISLFVSALVVTLAQVSRRVKSSNISMPATKASLVAMAERAPDERAVSAYKDEVEDYLHGKYSFVNGIKEIIEEIQFDLGEKASNENIDSSIVRDFFGSKANTGAFDNLDDVKGSIGALFCEHENKRRNQVRKPAMTESESALFTSSHTDEINATSELVLALHHHMEAPANKELLEKDCGQFLRRFVDSKFDKMASDEAKQNLLEEVRQAILKNFCHPDKVIFDKGLNAVFDEYIHANGRQRKKFTEKDCVAIHKHIQAIEKFEERLGEPLTKEAFAQPVPETTTEPVMVCMQRAKKNLHACYDTQITRLYNAAQDEADETTRAARERHIEIIHRTGEQRRVLHRLSCMGDRDWEQVERYARNDLNGKNSILDLANPNNKKSRGSVFLNVQQPQDLNVQQPQDNGPFKRTDAELKPDQENNPVLFYMVGGQDPVTRSDTIADYAHRLSGLVKKNAKSPAATPRASTFGPLNGRPSSGEETFTPAMLARRVSEEHGLDLSVLIDVEVLGQDGSESPLYGPDL